MTTTVNLEKNTSFPIYSSDISVNGAEGFETIKIIDKNVTNIIADDKIEQFKLPDKFSNYKFLGTENGLEIQNKSNNAVVIIPNPLLSNNVIIAFADGSAELAKDKTLNGVDISKLTTTMPSNFNKTVTSKSKPSISITSDSEKTIEGNDASFTIKLSEPQNTDITLNYTVAGKNKTTTDVADIENNQTKFPINNSSVIKAGETTAIITIPVKFDTNIETNEGIQVKLASANNSILIDKIKNVATTSFVDPTHPTFTVISDTKEGIATAEGKLITFTVTPNSIVNVDTTLSINLTGDVSTGVVAASDSDFEIIDKEMKFKAGTKNAVTLKMSVVSDGSVEGIEGYKIQLTDNVQPANIIPSITGTIKEKLPTATLKTNTKIADEGSDIILTVTLDSTAQTTLNVPYKLSGTNLTTNDFTNLSSLEGSIKIDTNETEGSLTLNVAKDLTTEDIQEVITAQLNATNSVDVDATKTDIKITDTSKDAAGVILLTGSSTEKEGSTAIYQVTIDAPVRDKPVNIPYKLTGTATADADYIGNKEGVFTIPVGAKTGTVSLPIKADNSLTEGDEEIIINLDKPSFGTIVGLNSVKTTIKDVSVSKITLSSANPNFDASLYAFDNKTPVIIVGSADVNKIILEENRTGQHFVVNQDKGGSGVYSLGNIVGNIMPTKNFDVIYGLSAGDSINLASYTQTKNLNSNIANFTLPSGTDNKIMRGEGWYNNITNEFTLLNSGIDSLLIYDSTPTVGITKNERSYEALILVGISLVDTATIKVSADGTITF